MGSKASTPVVVKEVLNQACNMRDLNSSFSNITQAMLVSCVVIVFLILFLSIIAICVIRRNYRKKLRLVSFRTPRSLLPSSV